MVEVNSLTIAKPIRFKRPAVVNTDLFTRVNQKDFFNTRNQLSLFPHRKRCRLEQAMLMFGSHVVYLSAVMEKPIIAFMANRAWASHWFPLIWESSKKSVGLAETDFDKLKNLVEQVSSDLFLIYGGIYDSRIFNYVKKGVVK